MSNNVTAGAGGSIFGMVSLAVQNIQVQSMVEVFAYGIVGGIAGILGKIIAELIVRKFKKVFKIETKKKQKDANEE